MIKLTILTVGTVWFMALTFLLGSILIGDLGLGLTSVSVFIFLTGVLDKLNKELLMANAIQERLRNL